MSKITRVFGLDDIGPSDEEEAKRAEILRQQNAREEILREREADERRQQSILETLAVARRDSVKGTLGSSGFRGVSSNLGGRRA